jgi:hypothetical protein
MEYNSKTTTKEEVIDKIDATKSNSNLKVTKCYINAFSDFKKLMKNSGFVSLIIILIVFLIIFIIFCIKGRELFKNKIEEIIYKKFDKNKKKEQPKKEESKHENNIENKKNDIFNNNKSSNNKKVLVNKKRKSSKKIKKKTSKTSEIDSNNKLFNNENDNKKENKIKILNTVNNNTFKVNNNNKDSKENKTNKDDRPNKENDFEMNHLDYQQALEYDKREACEIYMSLIKSKQLFMFVFCSFNDYNSGIIKKFVLFLSFAIHFTISALFFNDNTMHQILKDEGKFNFSFMLPHILITFISSTGLMRIILETMILTDRDILKVKHCSTKKEANLMKIQVIKCINIKYIIFFISNFVLLCFFWFYLTCLADTYEKTQIYLIETTFTAFAFSFVFPFLWNIFPTILRCYSLATRKNEREGFYTASKILQLL